MNPVVMTVTLVAEDGVLIDAVHLPARVTTDAPVSDGTGSDGAVSDGAGTAPGGGELIAPPVPAEQRDLAIVIAHGFTMSWQRPATWNLMRRFNAAAGVVTFDFRGHGRSGGLSTLGDKEIYDLDVAVRYARGLGYRRVATVGFSMGGSVVLRHAALCGGVDAVVSVSGPGRWFYRGTTPMRRVHLAAETRLGRAFARRVLHTRISPDGWPVQDPLPPAAAAAQVAPVPLLIVHGDADIYFPPDHGKQLYDAAREPKEMWLLPGFGHAERHTDDALVDRIAAWADTASAAYQAGGGPARQARRAPAQQPAN